MPVIERIIYSQREKIIIIKSKKQAASMSGAKLSLSSFFDFNLISLVDIYSTVLILIVVDISIIIRIIF